MREGMDRYDPLTYWGLPFKTVCNGCLNRVSRDSLAKFSLAFTDLLVKGYGNPAHIRTDATWIMALAVIIQK